MELGFTSLRAQNPSRRSGILSFLPPEGITLPTLHDAIEELGVSCSIPDGCLRLAAQWPNSLEEADRVVESIEKGLETVGPV